jgi:putative transposase
VNGSVALAFAAVFGGLSPNPPPDVTTPRYKRHRFPAEIIAHTVWLYFRFPLSLRHIEDLLAEPGIEVSFQAVAEWVAKFGREYARSIRLRSRGSFADKWHLDAGVRRIAFSARRRVISVR